MFRGWRSSRIVLAIAVICTAWSAPVEAQTRSWDIFQDTLSDSRCDVINATNAELVVLSATGQLVIVSGQDVVLPDTFVDLGGFVFFGDDAAGLIEFATDADGLRSLWWMSITGHVVNVDGFTGEPTVSDQFPSDFSDAPCDACEFWDDQSVCPDSNDDDFTFPQIIINLCGANAQLGLALTAVSLGLMSLTRRRFG